jgi:hypothetical protein
MFPLIGDLTRPMALGVEFFGQHLTHARILSRGASRRNAMAQKEKNSSDSVALISRVIGTNSFRGSDSRPGSVADSMVHLAGHAHQRIDQLASAKIREMRDSCVQILHRLTEVTSASQSHLVISAADSQRPSPYKAYNGSCCTAAIRDRRKELAPHSPEGGRP